MFRSICRHAAVKSLRFTLSGIPAHWWWFEELILRRETSLIARFMGPTWGPSGADRTQLDPMLTPWTLLSGLLRNQFRPQRHQTSHQSDGLTSSLIYSVFHFMTNFIWFYLHHVLDICDYLDICLPLYHCCISFGICFNKGFWIDLICIELAAWFWHYLTFLFWRLTYGSRIVWYHQVKYFTVLHQNTRGIWSQINKSCI